MLQQLTVLQFMWLDAATQTFTFNHSCPKAVSGTLQETLEEHNGS
jgi:hypothetical protein